MVKKRFEFSSCNKVGPIGPTKEEINEQYKKTVVLLLKLLVKEFKSGKFHTQENILLKGLEQQAQHQSVQLIKEEKEQ